MKYHFMLIVALLGFMTAHSQSTGTIKGIILEKDTKEAIPFATVTILLKDSLIAGTTADIDGKYSFTLTPNSYQLSVSYIGFATYKIPITIKEKVTIKQDVALESAQLACELIISEVKEKRVSREKRLRHNILSSRNAAKRKSKELRYSSPSFKGGESPRPQHNTEDYSSIKENEYKAVKDAPLSTFSIDVDRASYANVRRFLNDNTRPPKDAVRIEEMINYFDYDYPQPKDNTPFAVITESSDCPWNKKAKLLHIGLQGKEIPTTNAPANNLVFLLDVSGSMNYGNKLPLVKASLKLLIQNMREEDRIAIVVYAGAAGVVLPSTSGKQKGSIIAALESLEAGGSTAGGQGIKLAYKIAKQHFIAEGNNRIILATDGDFNVGVSSDAGLEELIVEKRKDNIFLSVLGFGTGNYKDNKMETLADKGNGNYAYIDNILEAKKVLGKEMNATLHTIAKDVKLQIEFNPVLIESYRLVGYENRLLNDEDFNNDKKDAGELGAGHTVTALYEVILKNTKTTTTATKSVDDLKYQTSTATNYAQSSNELMTVKLRYKAPKGTVSKLVKIPVSNDFIALEKSSDNFRFAAAVAGWGMLLRDSKFKKNLSYENVLTLAKKAKGTDEEGYRAEFIRLVETASLLNTQAKK